MNKVIILALALIVMASCSKEKSPTIDPKTPVAAQFSNGVITRALNNAWQENDKIGIYMVAKDETLTDATTLEDAKNIAHTVGSAGTTGTFTPSETTQTIHFPMDNSEVDFYAYYPHQTDISNGVYKVNVASQVNFSLIDLLASKVGEKSKLTPQVKFDFEHQLSMITMNITIGAGIAETSKGLKVTIEGLSTIADFSLADNSFGASEAPGTITAVTTADGTQSQAILIPSGTVSGAQICFELATTEKFYWSIADKTFVSGQNITYNVTLNRTGVVISGSEITDWSHITSGNVSAE